ncbi:MAG: hypothetical protein HW411_544 [Gammaproteobacteria bacterium]|nr:hypothetical protein [Gammaproteobacteria bacterium]
MDQDGQANKITPELAAKNRRTAIIIGLIALAFYAGFILMNLH